MASLLLVTIMVVVIGRDSKGTDFDRKKFTLDENTVITTVILEGSDFTNRFEYISGSWQVNETYLIDQGMRDVFFALLSRVEIQRPVSSQERDSLARHLLSRGVKVTVLNNADTIKKYLVGGNEDRFQTYFMSMDDQQPYLVHIPGYQSFVAGIFEAGVNDWRSRFIWDIDWSSLKKLKVIPYDKANDSLVFEYRDNFIGMDGIAELDTSAMMGYLEDIAYLQTSKYLYDGEIPIYDQMIINSEPILTISVEQIGNRFSTLSIYAQPEGKQYLPGLLNENQKVLFQPAVLGNILHKLSDFERGE